MTATSPPLHVQSETAAFMLMRAGRYTEPMRQLLLLMLLAALTVPVAADEIAVLAGGSARGPVTEMAQAFRQQTGHLVTVAFDTTPNIIQRLASAQGPDVLIAATAVVDQALKEGRAIADTRIALGRVGTGVAVSRGAAHPDVSTADALKRALMQADAVLISQGASGTSALKMFGDLGVLDAIQSKIVRVESGAALIERLGTSRGEIGLGYVSELSYGAARGGGDVVGPVPASLQSFAGYDAVVMTGSRVPQVARQFVRTLASPAARTLFVASGWEIPDVRAQ